MAVAARLRDGERLLAFLDDLNIVTRTGWTVEVHNILREELWRHARISVDQGKKRIWNRGGIMPDQCNILEQVATAVDPTARVWRGNHEDRVESQGIIVLGTPVRHQEFVKQELLKIFAEHSNLVLKIPEVKDLQCAWLLLLYWCCQGEFLHENCALGIDRGILAEAR